MWLLNDDRVANFHHHLILTEFLRLTITSAVYATAEMRSMNNSNRYRKGSMLSTAILNVTRSADAAATNARTAKLSSQISEDHAVGSKYFTCENKALQIEFSGVVSVDAN